MADQNNTQQQETKSKKIPLTLNLLAAILANNGITIRLNTLSWNVDIITDPSKNTLISSADMGEQLLDNLPTILYDALFQSYSNCMENKIAADLRVISCREATNPVLDFISQVKWDGQDRLEQVYSMLGIPAKDTLSRTLIHLWLKQGIALLHNNRQTLFGGEAFLVLVGKQGCGKTRFFRKLAMRDEWFREGQRLSRFDKDDSRRAITTWIAEFGELESVIRDADYNALKNFVTSSYDEYRLPYAARDTQKPRRTLLAGTANSDKFLVDPTGNRRYWIVPMTKTHITDEEFNALDAAQLWAQIYAEVCPLSLAEKQKCFRLDKKTANLLAARNMKHNASRPYEDELRDIFAIVEREPKDWHYEWTTVSEWKDCFPSLKNAYVGTLGSRINEFIDAHEYKIKADRKKRSRLYFLPLKCDEQG